MRYELDDAEVTEAHEVELETRHLPENPDPGGGEPPDHAREWRVRPCVDVRRLQARCSGPW